VGDVFFGMEKQNIVSYQWIGLREKLQEHPMILLGKSMVSGFNFPLNQSIDHSVTVSEIKMMGDVFFRNGKTEYKCYKSNLGYSITGISWRIMVILKEYHIMAGYNTIGILGISCNGVIVAVEIGNPRHRAIEVYSWKLIKLNDGFSSKP
jgi:hypothetical protein